jgi:hypothetical protein
MANGHLGKFTPDWDWQRHTKGFGAKIFAIRQVIEVPKPAHGYPNRFDNAPIKPQRIGQSC